MTLYDAVKLYLVYLQAIHLSKANLKAYRSGLQDIMQFYGNQTPLDRMDNTKVLDYVSINDPFDCDPLHTERGTIYCNFIHWLMRNRMIPAWAAEMALIEQD